MKTNILTILALFFSLACSPSIYAQYRSLDEDVNIKEISLSSPKSDKLWDKSEQIFILELDENIDNSLIGGSKSNPRKHAVVLTHKQIEDIKADVEKKGECFIAKVPGIKRFYVPSLEKASNIESDIEGALFVHSLSYQKHPDTSVYEFCDSRACPISVGSHEIVESFQITKTSDVIYMIIGMSMNKNSEPIPWNTNDLDNNRTFDEIIVVLTIEQYKSLFK